MNKSHNYVGLFKIKAYSQYLQDVVKNYLCPCFSIFDSSISSREALIKKFINEMVIVNYKFDGKCFIELCNITI